MRIDYHNLKESQLDLEALREELEALNDLSEAFDEFVGMESFQGETADSIRAYIQEIQKPIINGMKMVITDLNSNLVHQKSTPKDTFLNLFNFCP